MLNLDGQHIFTLAKGEHIIVVFKVAFYKFGGDNPGWEISGLIQKIQW